MCIFSYLEIKTNFNLVSTVNCITFFYIFPFIGIIHSDLNEFNITINSLSNARQPEKTRDSKTRELSIKSERSLKSAFGFFDFEYCHRGYAIFDVAILMAYSALFVVRENSGLKVEMIGFIKTLF